MIQLIRLVSVCCCSAVRFKPVSLFVLSLNRIEVIFFVPRFDNADCIGVVFRKVKWKSPSQFVVPLFLKFDLSLVPSKKTEAVEASSKHFPSIENIKSISDFVAWMEYWALFNEIRPVDNFTSLVYGSFDVLKLQSWANEKNGDNNRRTKQNFIPKNNCCRRY